MMGLHDYDGGEPLGLYHMRCSESPAGSQDSKDFKLCCGLHWCTSLCLRSVRLCTSRHWRFVRMSSRSRGPRFVPRRMCQSSLHSRPKCMNPTLRFDLNDMSPLGHSVRNYSFQEKGRCSRSAHTRRKRLHFPKSLLSLA